MANVYFLAFRYHLHLIGAQRGKRRKDIFEAAVMRRCHISSSLVGTNVPIQTLDKLSEFIILLLLLLVF